MNFSKLIHCVLVGSFALSGFGSGFATTVASAAGDDPAGLLPADTVFYAVVPNVAAARAKLEKTSLWHLYKEPAMQAFVVPAEKAIREAVQEKLKEAWSELGIDAPPSELPLPTGRVVLGLRMVIKTRKVSAYDFEAPREAGTPPVPTMREVSSPVPQVVVIAEMGQNFVEMKRIFEQATEKAVDKGAKRRRETVRGLTVEIITPLAPKPAEEGGVLPTDPLAIESVAYAFKDTTLLVGNDVELVTGVLARMSGAQLPSLADDSDRAEAIRTIGGGGDLYGCVSAKRIVDIIKAAAPQEEKQKVERLIGALGFDNVSSAAMTLEIAPDESTQLRVKGVLAVRGPKRGIIAMLTPITATTASSLTSRPGLVSFFSANYDLGKMYDQMLQIMQAAGGPPIDMQVQMMMAMTAVNDTAGRPPVNFRQEVLGQLGYPVVVTTHLSKPYTDPGSSKIMFSLAARQAGVLDTTMSRIHWAMSRGNKDLRRELLGSTIYVVPPFMSDPSSPKIGFTVAGGRFVVGGIEGVEQAIRDLRREDLQTIQADPMYRYAAGHLPSQAGAWWYENKQIAAEAQWVQIKQAARKSAAESGDDEDQDNKEIAVGIGASFGSGIIAMTPMGQFLEAMKRYCDFSQLPDFDSVRKYFGASIGYVKETDSGIYLEAIELKSPPSQEVNAER